MAITQQLTYCFPTFPQPCLEINPNQKMNEKVRNMLFPSCLDQELFIT